MGPVLLFQRDPEAARRGQYFPRHLQVARHSDTRAQRDARPRTREQKQNFCRLLCDRLHAALAIHPDDVMVMIHFNTADDWSFSQGRMLSEEGLLS